MAIIDDKLDYERVQKLFSIVRNGRINLDISSNPDHRPSSLVNCQNYPTLSLQLRLPGDSSNTELIMNPMGPLHPQSFKNESRRTNDGTLVFGQNKFDAKGRQVCDFVIQFNQNSVQNIIAKNCPERFRG